MAHDDAQGEILAVDNSEPSQAETFDVPALNTDLDSGSPHLKAISSNISSTPSTPSLIASNGYFSASPSEDDAENMPPLDRLTVFDFLENLALPQRLEKLQYQLSLQTERVRRQQQKLKSTSKSAKNRVVEEWKRRTPQEKVTKYQKRVSDSVDRLGKQWNEYTTITLREKIAFIAGVLNIFISGYLVGAFPQWFHYWYTVQLAYYYPVRLYTYHKKGYHYFLADLCYFVNLLLLLSIWVFPGSRRLFLSAFCLGFGNNAVAIVMWRNSLVFHSLDKVVSLFIHIMPCVTMHCILHLIPNELRESRFPAAYRIKTVDHYSLLSMALWSSVPYACWQLSYHFLVTVRHREQIAAGRPTSFTWLRKSYSKTWIGRVVLSLPNFLQEPAFMMIQYTYALLTMLPVPIWFWNRWASAAFLLAIFTWSVYNGAVYYVDVYSKKFQKELEQLKRDVQRWQTSPELLAKTPTNENGPNGHAQELQDLSLGASAASNGENDQQHHNTASEQPKGSSTTAVDNASPPSAGLRERN